MFKNHVRVPMAMLGLLALQATAGAQTIDPYYSGNYSFTSLGSVPGVVPLYGGLTLLAGTTDRLLIGGSANTAGGQLYEIGITRDGSGHINGFSGTATVFAEAPYNDGGVTYGPNGVLFASRWPVNELGQYKFGSTTPDKVIDMAALGVAGSHAAISFVPTGQPGAGRVKLVSWSGGEFYDATVTPDGSGTFDLVGVSQTATLGGGPEGFAYVPIGSALFGTPSMIVSEYSAGNVATYEVDANGDPIVGTRRDFMVGLSGAEGAYIDPLTGDFLFSTFGGGDQVVVVTGFAVPEPMTMLVLAAGMGLLARRRRR
ncbi:MAG: PEP-CTERM sorting domain-containing protein [Fimbriimonadaceae bacterium]|nr:PEP-CTERM sorting domain-containing protein [Fimbriimonadaceae bacterium]